MTNLDITDLDAQALGLSTHGFEALRRAAAEEHVPQDAPGAAECVDAGYLVAEPHTGGLVISDVADLRRRRLDAAVRRDSALALLHTATQAAGTRDTGVTVLDSIDKANAAISRLFSEGPIRESWDCHPYDRYKATLESSIERDIAMLRAGTRMRSIYPHWARSRAPESEWTAKVSALGAEVRTLDATEETFVRLVIIDDRGAIVSDYRDDPPSRYKAILLRHPALVALARKTYRVQWAAATPWAGERDQTAGSLDAREAQFLALLDELGTVERVRMRMNISRTTASSLTRTLYERSGTDSLFGLGRWYASQPEAR